MLVWDFGGLKMGTAIAVANQKGGSGKTTVTLTLGGTLAARGYSVALVDTDPKQHLSKWHGRKGGAGTELYKECDPLRLSALIAKLQKSFEIVLIDTAAQESLANQGAIAMADLVLSPVKVSAFDADLGVEISAMVKSAEVQTRRTIPHAVLLTDIRPTVVSRHARKEIEETGVLILDAEWPTAVTFQESTWSGDVPSGETAGVRINKTIAALIEAGAIPAHPGKRS